MDKTIENTATETTVTETTQTTAPVAPAAPKEPSKKSQADAIFAEKLAEMKQGLFGSNKEFRAAVLTAIQTKLGVSTASAATMYNSAKKVAEAADQTVVLGRDPKKEKIKVSTGKRGRPVGSKNRPKAEVAPAAEVAPTADVAPAAEVAPAAVEAAPAEATA